MNTQDNIFDDVAQWDSRELGADESFVKSKGMSNKLKNLLNNRTSQKMQMISIRLPSTLIDDLKNIGEVEGIGYQALSREVLQRFVDAENRRKFNDVVAQKRELQRQVELMEAQIRELKHA
ncbi:MULTISPECIES: BrnA antitoxin family protein [Acinetobacter]|nr:MULTISPECIES: BrnA antitoxin family protein [Acinetobacter]